MIAERMARPGECLRAGSKGGFWCALLLGTSNAACGAAEQEPEPGSGGPAEYEGPNFYEMASGGSSALPAPEPGGLSGVETLPGFIGFVEDEEAILSCSLVTERAEAPPTDPALRCAPITRGTLSSFDTASGDPSGVYFGADSDVRGGTYSYASVAGDLRSDVTGGDWHLSGRISGIAGFGVYLEGCRQLDGSEFGGIEFSLWGSIGQGGSLVIIVGTAENQVSSGWLNANKPSPEAPDEPANLGRCVPFTSRYDGTCSEPRAALAVTDTPVTRLVGWRDLSAGCPASSVNAAELTTIAWYFPESPDGPYDVDIHIDNLRFASASPL